MTIPTKKQAMKTNNPEEGFGTISVAAILAESARRTPHRTALIVGEEETSYGDLWSETRAYMALVMGAVMAVVMLAFMLHMYESKAINIGIVAGAVLVFAAALYLVRSQATVEDVSCMRAMIPHHSIAILTSERANLSDPRVRKLAREIAEAQRREIDEMKTLIDELKAK